jgi:sugar/nucleoside kinase (ribokinase family)/sugar phosphate isomerase/epimerase
VVIGSANADTFLQVERLPREGENVLVRAGTAPLENVPGGKGCTQAVAVARMLKGETSAETAPLFVGQFGGDSVAAVLRDALEASNVRVPADLSLVHEGLVSGRGYVFVTSDGHVSAVVCGGSNQEGWQAWEAAWKEMQGMQSMLGNDETESVKSKFPLLRQVDKLLDGCACVLLQREVPEHVNRLVAAVVAERRRRSPESTTPIVIQDVGGEDRPMDREMMDGCDYLVPNESELKRLVATLTADDFPSRGGDDDNSSSVVEMAKVLQNHGARNVLVTLGRRGSTLVTESGNIITQPALPVEKVVDETGAGDCYRAAFAVGLAENRALQECMELASAAGACSVERQGAVPSAPTRIDVEDRLERNRRKIATEASVATAAEDAVLRIPRGDGLGTVLRGGGGGESDSHISDSFPFLIGSRLNSMKDRPDLWEASLNDPKDYVQRQSHITGLTCVDFNYPQHFHGWTAIKAKEALDAAGLKAGAVCLRYPSKFARGAMNHPNKVVRDEALALTKEAAQVAIELGCNEVVVWSAYDGYDYPFQVDYDTKWDELVSAFRECCDEFPAIKWSIEYKPTDENTRFFTVPSTGAALLLAAEVDRPNFGLTLDVGHMLMSGENPGQSIAMACRANKLFGVQLNDGYTRLAAEDGLIFGSVHPSMALEVMYQLRRGNFKGHVYFDTFPQRSDPVREAEYNIRRVKAFWNAAGWMDSDKLKAAMAEHDAIAALELIDEALKRE